MGKGGGPPSSPQIATGVGQQPNSVASYTSGGKTYTYVADATTDTVQRIDDSSGLTTVIAGVGAAGVSGNGGPALDAALDGPTGVAVDPSDGNVFFLDDGTRLRMIPASTAPFFGQSMVAVDIYTIAGTGTPGYSGDGGPGTSAEIGAGPDLRLPGRRRRGRPDDRRRGDRGCLQQPRAARQRRQRHDLHGRRERDRVRESAKLRGPAGRRPGRVAPS